MFEKDDAAREWLDQARFTLLAAEDLLVGGLSGEAISNSFLAMVYAARAATGKYAGESDGWEEVVEHFQREALPELRLSKENQRALPIVADLYRRVVLTREMEADPHTASACLEDARSFIDEVGDTLEGR